MNKALAMTAFWVGLGILGAIMLESTIGAVVNPVLASIKLNI